MFIRFTRDSRNKVAAGGAESAEKKCDPLFSLRLRGYKFRIVYFQQMILIFLMALLYIAAGIFHFVRPRFYLKIIPPWLPWHLPVVYISGICEIVLGALLLPEASRSFAAWGITGLLIIIFPANIQMMLNYRKKRHPMLWITILRLPLQVVLIAWAWQYT